MNLVHKFNRLLVHIVLTLLAPITLPVIGIGFICSLIKDAFIAGNQLYAKFGKWLIGGL